ncbi:obscurin-like protein 1 isoform X3 [Clupea harengus]|uniref:Obscurin-like protein 1 n=1 Tax=Clupea harengus TaxID=7950 RepID=A0A6P8GSI4_CLUHA|nr:obscurin-like protein 1 isoform X3 [Clupea harengus]
MDVFGGAPRFLAYPRPVVVQTGTDGVVKCQIGGDPRPAVIWERNNEQIHPEGRYRVFEDGNVYNLIITGATTEDSGQYICKAKNCIGETYAAATLKVEGEAQEIELREENKPRFLIKPLSTRVARGEDAVFSCKLWGNPRPEVVWEKDGRKLNEIFESTHFSVGYQEGGWFTLKLFKARAPDGGVYTCKARNEFGEGLAGAVLLVDAGPGHDDDGNRNGYTNGHWKGHQGKQRGGRQVASRLKEDPPNSTKVKMFAVTEGKHAKFRCYVTGKPKPEIIWRKDGRLIISGRRYLLYEDREGYFTLKVLYCKQQDNGVYVCAASNTAGQTLSAVHLSVKEPPVRFKQPLCDLQVWERDLAVLECEVPEDSVPITWYLEDRRLQPGAKYGMEEWGTKRRLTIRDIGVDDDGIYLCEMADGGRSIAEVAVKGTIVRKLPRKVDVLEGENAAFCVEVEEEEMDIHWYKDGVELRETHQTILKSFGRTHILVFVNTTPQDSGLVTFYVGRSKTSSQLRVKAVRHSPPSCPVGVQINTERANAALLSWVPAPDSRKNPPSGYVLERQEVGSQEWLQCVTTDSATSVEILGDSVPCEADYRFRICSVNKYGRSGNVEFPCPAHLVPVARIQAPLQDALVPEGQDACFSIELSASVIGTWFLNGTQLQEDDQYSMRRTRTHQSLRIRGVRETDNGAEITFIAYGIRDSAALYIQAPLVKFSHLSEMDRNKFIEVGNPIVLYCELSDPDAPVHWYKNGVELHSGEGLHIQSEGTMRRIVIQSAEFSHSGVYSCDAIDDVIRFNVEVEAPPARFSLLPDSVRSKSVEVGRPIVLQCELSDPTAQVFWYKDGTKLQQQSGLSTQSDGIKRTLIVQSAEFCHSGMYSCKTKGDAVQFNVDVKAPPVRFSAIPEAERRKCSEAGCPITLQCEVSDPTAHVLWHKDGTQLSVKSGLAFQSKGSLRTLHIESAERSDSGVYSCATKDDAIEFHVEIRAKPVRFAAVSEDEKSKCVEAGCPFQLQCELSDPSGTVCWYKDDRELLPKMGLDAQSDGPMRRLAVLSAEMCHAGLYSCKTPDDSVHFTVDIQESSSAQPVKLSALPEAVKCELPDEGPPAGIDCEISDPIAMVCSHKDEVELISKTEPQSKTEGTRTVVVHSRQLAGSEKYNCVKENGVIQLDVQDQAPPVKFEAAAEVERIESVDPSVTTVLQWESSESTAQVCWHKVGSELLHEAGTMIPSESAVRKLTNLRVAELSQTGICNSVKANDAFQINVDIKGAEPSHSDPLSEISDDSIQCTVDRKAPSMDITAPSEVERQISNEAENPVSEDYDTGHSTVEVGLHRDELHDGTDVLQQDRLEMQSHGTVEEKVVVPSMVSHREDIICETLEHTEQSHEDVKATQVTIADVPEIERNKSIEAGCPIELQCEISNPSDPVFWYKDGTELLPQNGFIIQSETTVRRLIIPSAQLCHTGVYSCKVVDDVIIFKVDVKAPPPQFSTIPEVEKNKSIEAGSPIALRCEISDPTTEVCWYKDGVRLHPQSGNAILSEGTLRTLVVQAAGPSHSGVYSCQTKDTALHFAVDIKAPPVKFCAIPEDKQNKCIEAGCPFELQCEISNPAAHVSWYKDGRELEPQGEIETLSEGAKRKLSVLAAEVQHTGIYTCKTADDAIRFNVDVKAPSPRFIPLPEVERNKSVTVGQPIVLKCGISDHKAEVSWYKDREQLSGKHGLTMETEGKERKLIVASAHLSDSGHYSCAVADDAVSFKVDVQAVPVRFSALPDVARNKFVEAGCPIVLQCEISDPTAQVSWLKDEHQVLPLTGLDILSEGTIRTLIIQSAELSHSGAYRCQCEDDRIAFKVDVAAPPVTFVYVPEEDLHKNIVEQECLTLSCEVSRPDAITQWYKDGVEVQPDDNTSIETESTVRKLLIQASQLSDSGTYTCRAGDSALMFKVNVREPPVKIVYPKEDVHLDRHVPEEIVLSCELSRPNASVTWFKDGQKLQDSENIKLKTEGPYRRLKILRSGVEDSGEYVCDTADDRIFFQLNITEPPVRIVSPSQSQMELCQQNAERMVLSCEISRANAVVRWYRDGLEVEENDNLILEVDGVYRRLIIPETTVKDSAEYACDTGDDSVSFFVNIAEPPVRFIRPRKMACGVDIFVGDPILLDCEVSRPNAEVTWKKNGEEIEENAKVTISEDGLNRQLAIQSATLEDAGQYMCDAKDDVMDFHVSVTEAPIQILRKDQIETEKNIVTPDDIVLKCELSRSNGIVVWYKDNETIVESERVSCEAEGAFRTLVILNAEITDAGEFICNAKDDKVQFSVTVQEPPTKFVNKEEENKIVTCENDRVTLCAKVNKEKAKVRWLKDKEPIMGSRFQTSTDGKNCYLIIDPVKKSDCGTFLCDATTDGIDFILLVKELKVKFAKPLENAIGLKDSDLILRCELYKPSGDVQWLKDNKEITPSRRFTIRTNGCERSLTIHNVTLEDAGVYTCESKDERTCATVEVKKPRVVEFIAELHNITVMEGEDATFKCVLSPEDAKLVWCMNDKPIVADERFTMSSSSLSHTLHIHNCQVTDTSRVTAEAEGVVSKASLQVQEAQVMFTKSMEDVVAEEFGETTLEVEVSLDCGEVQWMRHGLVIQAGPKFTLKQIDRKRSLTIHKLALSDRGTYSCETLHDRAQAKLSVEPRKIKIRKGLSEIQTFERETASFEVELSHCNVEAAWQKDGARLKTNNHWRMSNKGRVHSLTISNLTLEDTGTYMFSTENVKTSARLTVKEPPVTILKKLEDVRFPEASAVTIECELSRHNIEVKWMKDGVEMKPGKNHRIYSMGRKRFFQILKCEMDDSGVYMCDAGDISTSCSLEVFEPALEVIQGLEDQDIQEDENAVFMVELSLDSVMGEWIKNGEKIKPSSTIKIRQEGAKHFLLMCNVKGEDSGEIKFVAKNIESTAYLEVEELPVNIVQPLQDKTALEKSRVIMDCSVSNPRCSIRWYKGSNVILPSDRFEICSEGCYRKLVIQQVALEDEGTYSVQVGDYTCSAKLTVEAQSLLMVRELQDVEVVAPDEAYFECEVSMPVTKPPVWTLNGESLQPGPRVLVEKMGTVHRLTLRQMSADMTGVIQFTSGKAKSTANLLVKSKSLE